MQWTLLPGEREHSHVQPLEIWAFLDKLCSRHAAGLWEQYRTSSVALRGSWRLPGCSMLAGETVEAWTEGGFLWSFAVEKGFSCLTNAVLSAVIVL